jgi:hypothetical protein
MLDGYLYNNTLNGLIYLYLYRHEGNIHPLIPPLVHRTSGMHLTILQTQTPPFWEVAGISTPASLK